MKLAIGTCSLIAIKEDIAYELRGKGSYLKIPYGQLVISYHESFLGSYLILRILIKNL